MVRPTSPTVTDAERAILEVLWDRGEASVREVADALSATKAVAYNTVLTMLGILLRKSLVEYRQEGRAFIHRASVSPHEVRTQAPDNPPRPFLQAFPQVTGTPPCPQTPDASRSRIQSAPARNVPGVSPRPA